MTVLWPASNDGGVRTRPFFEWQGGRANKEETGNLFIALAQCGADCLVVGCPAGDPARHEAVRVCSVEQVHTHRANAHLLFPKRNFGGRLRSE